MARTGIYGQWELGPVEIPNRTRLFSLEPAGIGTPEVESLSGYIARLAQAHVVSVGNLLGRGLTGRKRCKSSVAGPISAKTIQSGGHGFHALGNTINGFDWRARKWTRKIAAATGRLDIEQLTLIPFARVLSAMLLFKPHRAWCPFCYEEDRKSGVLYERLARAIKLVTVCPRHRTPLLGSCQGCGRRQPALAVFSWPGTLRTAVSGSEQTPRSVTVIMQTDVRSLRNTSFTLRSSWANCWELAGLLADYRWPDSAGIVDMHGSRG
jgi:TniQ